MNEERSQDYLNLIDALLSCPSGEEPTILDANSDLIDDGLLQRMEEIAADFAEEGDQNSADWLRDVVTELAAVMGNLSAVSTSDEYLDFLIEVLQATEESGFEPQVVYPLLEANLEKLNENFTRVLRNWVTAILPEVEPEEAYGIAVAVGNFSLLIQEFVQRNQANNIEIAIAGYELVITVITREVSPEEWAILQNHLGLAYLKRIDGNLAQNWEGAIAAFQAALQVYTREALPHQWAEIQNNLGLAYFNRIQGDRSLNIEQAIWYYQAALEVYPRSQIPQDWATIQNNLGLAYLHLIRADRAENLEAAIAAFSAALQVRTREELPQQWAETQKNLGNTYTERICGNRAENVEAAIAAYIKALQVYSYETSPLDWAMLQDDLGNAYCDLIRGDWVKNQEAAIAAFQSALLVYTREEFPEDWARTQNNLATIYSDQTRGDKAENLELAIKACENALKVYTRSEFPEDWAMVQTNLGAAYRVRVQGDFAENLEIAIRCYNAALEEHTREQFPEDWAGLQNNLGNAYRERIRGERAENLEQSLCHFNAALFVYTPESFPQDWAMIQNNLALTYYDLGQIDKAIAYFRSALEICTPSTFAVDCLHYGGELGDRTFAVGRWAEAIEGYGVAIEVIEQTRYGVSTEARRQEILQQDIDVYQHMVQACVNNNNREKAIEYAERSKTRNLVELLANKNLFPKRDLYPNQQTYQTHREQLYKLRQQIPAKDRQLERLTRNRESEERYRDEIEQRRQELNHLQQQMDKLLGEINQVDPSFTFTQKVEVIPYSDIQALTDENTAIVEWYITGSQILSFIITRHNPHPIVLPSSPEDMKALEVWDKEYQDAYRQQKSQWITNLASRLQHLAEILHIDDILARIDEIFEEKGLKCDRLILIPHRYLHLFPIHALPLANGDFLCDRFSNGVGYAPSCQLLQLTQKRERPEFSNFFAIQNPTDDLLYTNLEVETICSSFPSAQVLVKQAATKIALNASQDLPLAHCNHFSCHGEFKLTSPIESALLLANKERLTLGEIFGLNLNQCRLVTLSACETGLSDPTRPSWQK